MQAAIDIISGQELLITVKEKGKVIDLLSKLGVKCTVQQEIITNVMPQETTRAQQSNKISKSQQESSFPSTSAESIDIGMRPLVHPDPDPTISTVSVGETVSEVSVGVDKYVRKEMTEERENSNKEDFFAILDQFTETSDKELEKINHMLFGESGSKNRGYKCLKCELQFKYFTQAKKHHSEHEFTRLAPVREKLKKAEMDRQNDEQDIAKFEKAIGVTEKKKLKRALRQINENLHKHLETLDGLEKTKLPQHLRQKCKDYSRSLLATSKKADKVIDKLVK